MHMARINTAFNEVINQAPYALTGQCTTDFFCLQSQHACMCVCVSTLKAINNYSCESQQKSALGVSNKGSKDEAVIAINLIGDISILVPSYITIVRQSTIHSYKR